MFIAGLYSRQTRRTSMFFATKGAIASSLAPESVMRMSMPSSGQNSYVAATPNLLWSATTILFFTRTLLPTLFGPRSRMPITAALSLPPVPVIFSARLSACMLRAFPRCTFRPLHLPRELVPRSHAQRKPDAVIHEPCGFLGDVECPPDFATADAVLAIGNQPRRHQPLV